MGAHRLRLARSHARRIAFIGSDGAANLGDDAMRELAQRELGEAVLDSLTSPWLERRLRERHRCGEYRGRFRDWIPSIARPVGGGG
jgi:hypothetical protein